VSQLGWDCRDHRGRRRNLCACGAEFRSGDQLDRDGRPGRAARAGNPRPSRWHGLEPGRRIQAHPDHPSPQRPWIRDRARSALAFQAADTAYGSAWSRAS